MGTIGERIYKFSSPWPYPHSSGKNIQITHPEMERRDEITADTLYYIYDTPGDNDDMNDEQQINDILFGSHHQTHVNSNELWSLQKAIETTFGKFLDKFETYPEKVNEHHIPKQTTTSTSIIKHLDDELSEGSDDEIIQILIPRFDEPRPTPETQHDEMPMLTIAVTPEEMETFHLPDVQIEQPQIITTLTKAE
ncbi:unnamed protein product [Rotaria magnacalcarata]|uniref:Uncharacterized protein n=1 Tax=Rotaria magnacalcarata TaxID=392030 RepID=A0A816VAK5_9BILA|nr:unnamed protein product [Rotaria magnacalcarata]